MLGCVQHCGKERITSDFVTPPDGRILNIITGSADLVNFHEVLVVFNVHRALIPISTAKFERDLISERVRDGMARAKNEDGQHRVN